MTGRIWVWRVWNAGISESNLHTFLPLRPEKSPCTEPLPPLPRECSLCHTWTGSVLTLKKNKWKSCFSYFSAQCVYILYIDILYLAVATITLIWLRLIADAFLDCLSICLNYCSILSYISPYVLTEQKSRICSLKCNWFKLFVGHFVSFLNCFLHQTVQAHKFTLTIIHGGYFQNRQLAL